MYKSVLLSSLALALGTVLPAQVTHWRAVKGPLYEQAKNNTPQGSPLDWAIDAYVFTTSIGDAKSVTISGGGIPGSFPLMRDGTDWEFAMDFPSQAALNVIFPSTASYTLTLSGGTLGTLTQSFTFGTELYPVVPYLTGTVLTDVLNYKASAPFTISNNSPGPLTQSSGVTNFGIFTMLDDEVFYQLKQGIATSFIIPSSTLKSTECYFGYLEFTHAKVAPGSGFGIPGTTSHNVGLEFPIRTFSGPTASETIRLGTPANPNALRPGTTFGPEIGKVWDPRIDHSSFAPLAVSDAILLSLAPSNLPLPFGTLLLDPATVLASFTTSPGTAFNIPIPYFCLKAPASFYIQGVSISAGAKLDLTNAIDCVLGY